MDDDVTEAAREAWVELVRRAMGEEWTDRESWTAAKATIHELHARFGSDGGQAFSTFEARIYRLFVMSPAAEDVEHERRMAARERRRASAGARSAMGPTPATR